MSKKNTSLVLRCNSADMSSYGGFVWPGVGETASASDWRDNTSCGHGLHGWLFGQGDYSASSFVHDADAKWLVVEVLDSDIRMLGGKCKFPKGKVVFVGTRSDAAAYLLANEPRAQAVEVIGAVRAVGDNEVVAVGALGTATAGTRGTATAGYGGTATAGYGGTATAGDSGTATAGYGGELRIKHWDNKAERYRTKVAYVGEDGIEANVAYRLDDNGKFVKAGA